MGCPQRLLLALNALMPRHDIERLRQVPKVAPRYGSKPVCVREVRSVYVAIAGDRKPDDLGSHVNSPDGFGVGSYHGQPSMG